VFLSESGEYLPSRVVDNTYFEACTGRPAEWFERLTGIRERRRASAEENTNTMSVAAVENLLQTNPNALRDVDLVVGASYTPWDTIGTIAHVVQKHFSIRRAKALYISTACSSFIDALDLAVAYCESGRAKKALLIAAEHNSLFSTDADEKSGHLWGDGAAAVVLDSMSTGQRMRVVDVVTIGLADLGYGPAAIQMQSRSVGLKMAQGRDVFAHACREMVRSARLVLARNRVSMGDVRLLIPHQANKRIIDRVVDELGLARDCSALTVDTLGNTGCASVAITYHRHWRLIGPGEFALLVTFGGGYAAGAALLRKEGL